MQRDNASRSQANKRSGRTWKQRPPQQHNSNPQHWPNPGQSTSQQNLHPPYESQGGPYVDQHTAYPRQNSSYQGQNQSGPRSRGRRRISREEYRRAQRRIWIQIGLTMTVILLVAALAVFGAVKLISSFTQKSAPPPVPPANPIVNPIVDSEPSESVTQPEPTVADAVQIQELLAQADQLAAGYDYDAALELLQSYGSDWKEQQGFEEASTRYQAEKAKLVRWPDTTQITHIFFHSLIADPSRAFDSDYTNDGYNQYMATVDEFRAILEELYDRGYVLVRMHDVAKLTTGEDGQQRYVQGDIYLPPDKKPIILSQDDVNYYEYMIDGDEDHFADAQGDGFATRIVVGEDGYPTCAYITEQGETVYGEYDIVPILESFCQQHPDFSYRGARGVLGVTGYQGVFGYRTHPDWRAILGEDAYQEDYAQAKLVSQCLKDKGWEIASHSFGHPAYGEISDARVIEDVAKWEEQVQPVVGDTDIFLYPYGSDIAGLEDYCGAKFDALYDAGYRYFCNVDSAQYWTQIHDDYVRQGRRNIDGYRMWWNPELLDDLFDVEQILDPNRPTPVPSIV